jgi:hypothetical protein
MIRSATTRAEECTTPLADALTTGGHAASSRRKLLVAQLKARRGLSPASFQGPSSATGLQAVRITLPVTCAFSPRDVCTTGMIFSCHPCDQYRLVMNADGTYRGKTQQEFSRRLRCQCPNKTVVLRLVTKTTAVVSPLDDDSSQPSNETSNEPTSDEDPSPGDSQASSISTYTLRKRKACVYEIPDLSTDFSDSEDPHFERLVESVVTKRACAAPTEPVAMREAAAQTDAMVDNGNILQSTSAFSLVSVATQTNTLPAAPARRILVARNDQETQTDISLRHNIMGSISRWSRPIGKDLELALGRAISDETSKNLRKVTKNQRKINLDLLARALMSVSKFTYISRQIKTRANAIVFCTFRHLCQWKPELFHEAVLVESRQFLRRHVFQPWKFQKSIDTNAAGGLNYESCNSIRNDVEELASNTTGVIPHGTTIAKYAKLLEQHAAKDFGLDIIVEKTSHGPSLTFDLDNLLRLIICGYGLDKFATTCSGHKQVMLAHTLDGAMLTSHLGHVTVGIKIVDPRASNPLTGIPIGLSGLFQTRDLCYPAQIVFGKDCKSLYNDCFKPFHSRFGAGLVIPANNTCPEFSNFQIIAPQDMSSIWKTVGLGGGCYNKKQFCYCCMCTNDLISVHKSGESRCDLCIRLEVTRCYCHPVNDEAFLQGTQRMLEQHVQSALDEGYSKLDAISAKSKISTNPQIANKESIHNHIDFVPSSDSEVTQFSKLIKAELKLRFISSNVVGFQASMEGSYHDRRNRLKCLIAEEDRIHLARSTIQRSESVRHIAEKVLAEQAVPCVLHLEMRINEKVFWTLLSLAIDRYQEGDSTTRKLFVAKVTECMKTTVLGNIDNEIEYQWKFPLKDSGKRVDPKSMTNVHSRKCVMGMKSLSYIIFSQELDEKSHNPTITRQKNESLLQLWLKLMDAYIDTMKVLRQHEDFTDSQVDNLHKLTSTFMGQWVDCMKGDSITNYIHMIGSGHLTYYVATYKNLYKFSQQGWEAMNQKLKYFYFHNTNHGGCGGKHAGALSGDHVLPLMRLMQRSIMWDLGLGDAFFRSETVTIFQQADETDGDAMETAMI